MTSPPVQIERRVGQRFPYLLAISFRQPTGGGEGVGFTQDLSSRGVFFFTDSALTEGAEIELTLRMPSEITLGETMPVRCKGHVLRVVRPALGSGHEGTSRAEARIGVAVRLEKYEYLPESTETPATLARVSALHPRHEEEHVGQATLPRGWR